MTQRAKPFTASFLMLSFVAGCSSLALAQEASDWHATLYEVAETMTVRGSDLRRTATATLIGTANYGTPVCPQALHQALLDVGLALGAKDCIVTGLASDNISLATGTGPVHASFAVVIQDSPFSVDAAEVVMLHGSFTGEVDLSAFTVSSIPLGMVNGSWRAIGSPNVLDGKLAGLDVQGSFKGIFRLPFNGKVMSGEGITLRQALCPSTPAPNPFFGPASPDFAYMATDAEGNPAGRCLDIRPEELAIGKPTVRLDIRFLP